MFVIHYLFSPGLTPPACKYPLFHYIIIITVFKFTCLLMVKFMYIACSAQSDHIVNSLHVHNTCVLVMYTDRPYDGPSIIPAARLDQQYQPFSFQ
jgi:hypothetical protein